MHDFVDFVTSWYFFGVATVLGLIATPVIIILIVLNSTRRDRRRR